MKHEKGNIIKIEFECKTVDIENFKKVVSQHLETMINKTKNVLFEFIEVMDEEKIALLKVYNKLEKSDSTTAAKFDTPAKFIDNIFFSTTGKQMKDIEDKSFLYHPLLKESLPTGKEDEKKSLCEMLSNDWKISHHTNRIIYWLHVARSFYTILRENEIFILTDIPDILIMDRRVLALTETVKTITSQTKRRQGEGKRSVGVGVSKGDNKEKAAKIIDSILFNTIKQRVNFKNRTELTRKIEFEMTKKYENGEIKKEVTRSEKFISLRLQNEHCLSVKNFLEDFKNFIFKNGIRGNDRQP